MKKKAKVRGKSASIAAAKGHTNGGKTAHAAVSQSLSLLSEISQEITSVLDRDELFGRIADRVKKVVDYHLFSVMLWNEKSTQLEIVFSVHFGEPIPARFRVPLYKGITGHAAVSASRFAWMTFARILAKWNFQTASACVPSWLFC